MKDERDPKIRTRSGAVDSDDKLTAFLYLMLRDYVLPGDVERVMRDLTTASEQDGLPPRYSFCNGWLATYASDIAERLK